MPLKSRRQFPPHGFTFYEPRTGWYSQGGLDFDQTVAAIIKHRLANPRFAKEWATDVEDVANELDTYTCQRIGNDPNYCDGGQPPSFHWGWSQQTRATGPSKFAGVGAAVSKVSAGFGLVHDWLGDDCRPVSHELAEQRASICIECPKNNRANLLERIFTAPAVLTLRKQIAIKQDMKLFTSHDANLFTCDACFCVLELKCHVPMEHILKHLNDSIRKDLDPRCWILREEKEASSLQ